MNIRKAKADDRIDAILLRMGMLAGDWAKVAELREAILDFRASGKKASTPTSRRPPNSTRNTTWPRPATGSSSIPSAGSAITGVGGYVPFLKRGLDKLGIEAEVEHVEEYKTAYNMFTESGFTPAHREMLESISLRRHLRAVRGRGGLRPEEDAGGGPEPHRPRLLPGTAGRRGRARRRVAVRGRGRRPVPQRGPDPARIALGGIRPGQPRGRRPPPGPARRPDLRKRGDPSGEGLPATIGGATLAGWIRAAREDGTIAAVVFRVDSPGGSAVASDMIWREVMLCRKVKPFVVSMSDLAGSGGYWISMAAHRIVAEPQTLTGSIGVSMGKFDMEKLLDKLGITCGKLVRGARADVFSAFRPWTDRGAGRGAGNRSGGSRTAS